MRLTKSVVPQIGHYVIVLLAVKDVVEVKEVCPGVYVDVTVLGEFDDILRVISKGSSVQRSSSSLDNVFYLGNILIELENNRFVQKLTPCLGAPDAAIEKTIGLPSGLIKRHGDIT